MTAIISSTTTGLAMKSLMPAVMQRSRSDASTPAVMAITGKFKRSSVRMIWVALKPSMTGICMSISTMS